MSALGWQYALLALCFAFLGVCAFGIYLSDRLGRYPRRNRRVALPKPSDLCRRDWSEREMEALRPRR